MNTTSVGFSSLAEITLLDAYEGDAVGVRNSAMIGPVAAEAAMGRYVMANTHRYEYYERALL